MFSKGAKMLISCPKCHITYNIDATAIPQGGRKLHCTNCDEFFWCNPEDLEEPTRLLTEEEKNSFAQAPGRENPAMKAAELNNSIFAAKESDESPSESAPTEVNNTEVASEPTEETADIPQNAEPDNSADEEGEKAESKVENFDPQADVSDDIDEKTQTQQDIQSIFQRLSAQSAQIDKLEHEMNFFKRGCRIVAHTLGLENRFNRWMFLVLLLVFVLLGLYTARYEITRQLPWAEQIFNAVGIESKIIGEGLKFSNVSRREFEVDDINHMEIRGFIDNETDRSLEIPTLHVEVLDDNGEIIQQQDEVLFVREIAPGDRKPFKIDIQKPSILGKYIYITFVK